MSTDDNDPDWGPWQNHGWPRPGTYVQIDCYRRDNPTDHTRIEGLLRKIVDGFAIMEPPHDDSDSWVAYRWRARRPRGMWHLEAVLRRVERTHRPRRSRVGEDA